MVSLPHTTHSADPQDDPDQRDYYSVSQAAALFGVSRVSVWRWISAGRLPAQRLGHRTVRIQRRDLERALARVGTAPANAENSLAPLLDWREMDASEHVAQFYEAEAFLLETVAGFIGAALRAGDSGIVVATPPHRASLDERLQADGLDLAAARAGGRYVSLDAAETLEAFMVDGAPDLERFAEVIGSLVARAAEGGRRVRVFGEMVALLAAEGNHAAAIRLEVLWNDLQKTHAFSLFCAYPMGVLVGEAHTAHLAEVCAEHGRVIPLESYLELPTSDDRLRTITLLQQKSRSLEAEVARRKEAEAQLRRALEAERAAREEAEAALRLRDEFLSIASHELRTPLTTLSAHAQLALRRLARQGQLEPERVVQAFETITGQSEKLSRLLTQLLDISRLESGNLPLERQPTNLTRLVEQAVTSARSWSDRHTIAFEAPPSLEAPVDPLRLEQVLTNLLDNAIKYSPDGGPIEVTLRVGDRSQEPGAGADLPTPVSRREAAPQGRVPTPIEISVRDHGLGIPPEKRARIFERFYQAHSGGPRSGIGLGLYISRQIVELHDGEIRAEFPPDGGTCFVLRLPLALEASAAA